MHERFLCLQRQIKCVAVTHYYTSEFYNMRTPVLRFLFLLVKCKIIYQYCDNYLINVQNKVICRPPDIYDLQNEHMFYHTQCVCLCVYTNKAYFILINMQKKLHITYGLYLRDIFIMKMKCYPGNIKPHFVFKMNKKGIFIKVILTFAINEFK